MTRRQALTTLAAGASAAVVAGAASARTDDAPQTATHGVDMLPALIPMPASYRSLEGHFELSSVRCILVGANANPIRPHLEQLARVLQELTGRRPPLRTVSAKRPTGAISIATDDQLEQLGREGYELEVTPSGVALRAHTQTGLFYGVQTLRQLLPMPGDGLSLGALKIRDLPRYPWRGLLLDCCRHFMSTKFVKRCIDLLAHHKFNRLHWHLTEDQGWRIEVKRYPKLTQVGSKRSQNEPGAVGFYTQREIRDILGYAADRQVMVVPEIEMPGHCTAALAAYPTLSCEGKALTVSTEWGIHKDVYCAGNEQVFEFLQNVLDEVIELFPSSHIHLGGDEVPKDRWQACPKCQARIAKEKLKDEKDLQSYFMRRMAQHVASRGRQSICWDEIVEEGRAPPGMVVQAWRGEKATRLALRAGHQTIVSPYSHVYFDYALDVSDLGDVYGFDPRPAGVHEKVAGQVIGSEACLWSEGAPESLVEEKVFPRLFGLAEVLWTAPARRDFEAFYRRCRKHSARLIKTKGLRVGPALFKGYDVGPEFLNARP
ncbi:MAG TPA: beta-N-acetylhexosaminidase [Polyangiaceae bacterium]